MSLRTLVLAAAALCLAGCPSSSPEGSSDAGPSTDAGAVDAGGIADAGPLDAGEVDAGPVDAGEVDAGPYGACDVHASSASQLVDRTDAWNLGQDGGLAMTGNRIMAADLDGDGYPDLIIHAIYSNARSDVPLDDGGRGRRYEHVLMNRPRPGGGRMFVNATVASGVFQLPGDAGGALRSAQLAVAGDIDNDGDLDLFSGTNVDPTSPATDPGDRSQILLNDGAGHFTPAPPTDPTPGAADLWPTTGASFVDANRDGQLDLFVGFWYAKYGYTQYGVQAQLYQGHGDGGFTSITIDAGLKTDPYSFVGDENSKPAYGVTTCDLDGDGAPELLVSAYGRQWNSLYENDGTGHFSEIGQASGYAGDDDLDYKDNQFFACWCESYPMSNLCGGVAPPLIQCPSPPSADWAPASDTKPWRLNGNTFTTVCRDLTGDGVPDLYSAEIRHWHIGQSSDPSELLVGDGTPGHPHFTRPGNAATGMVWPHPTEDWNEGGIMAAPADLDNDARTDLIVAATDYPDQFGLVFHQKPDGTFEEVGAPWGMHHACMSGLAVADFDRDGDLDVVVGSGTARDCSAIWHSNEVHLYENDASEHAHWLEVRLQGNGTTANRSAIGAVVTVEAGGVKQVQALGGGYGHMAMENDTVLHFGLGACAGATTVTVRWPDAAGTTQVFDAVPADALVELAQGDDQAHPVTLDP